MQLITGLRALGLTEAQIQRLARHAEQSERLVGPYLAELLGDVRARTEARIGELRQLLERVDDFESRHRAALAGKAEADPWGPNPRRCSTLRLDPTPGGRPYRRQRQRHTAPQNHL